MDLRYWNSATPLEKDFCIFRNGSSPLAQQGVFTSVEPLLPSKVNHGGVGGGTLLVPFWT